MILEKRLLEKDRTLDDLFNEYEKVRIMNQQLTVTSSFNHLFLVSEQGEARQRRIPRAYNFLLSDFL